MIGDVYLLEEKHKDAAKSVIDSIVKKCKSLKKVKKHVIAISGKSGSGKSEVAHEISLEFKRRGKIAKVISIDNFYNVHPIRRLEWRKKKGVGKIVGLDELDWKKVDGVVKKFKADKMCKMPIVDKHSDQIDTLETDFKGVDVLVIDGLYAINTEKADTKIMIETTWETTVEAQRRRGKEDLDKHRVDVLMKESEVVDTLPEKADLIILADDYSLKIVKQK